MQKICMFVVDCFLASAYSHPQPSACLFQEKDEYVSEGNYELEWSLNHTFFASYLWHQLSSMLKTNQKTIRGNSSSESSSSRKRLNVRGDLDLTPILLFHVFIFLKFLWKLRLDKLCRKGKKMKAKKRKEKKTCWRGWQRLRSWR